MLNIFILTTTKKTMDAIALADTGSILLMKGNHFYSRVIEWACHSDWSHVAVIVQGWGNDKRTFILESNHSEHYLHDTLTNKEAYDGVRLVDANKLLKLRKGDLIVLRKLVPPTSDIYRTTCDFAREMAGRKYERKRMQLVKSWYDGPGGEARQDLSMLFCSELVAELYMRAGLIQRKLPASEYTPADFGMRRNVEKDVARSGHCLTQCILINSPD